jgi:hypothetical protein
MLRSRWLRLPRPASSRGKQASPPACRSLRPRLEVLEDRTAPTAFNTTVNSISVNPATYTLTQQSETVTVQAMYTNGTTQIPVDPGTQIQVTDNGQTQIATVTGTNGQATTTFNFSLFAGQEQPNAHPVTGQVLAQAEPGTNNANTFNASGISSTQAPSTINQFFFQIEIDVYLIQNGFGFFLLAGSNSTI